MKPPARIPPGATLSMVSLQVIAFYALRGARGGHDIILCPAARYECDTPRGAFGRMRELAEDILEGRAVEHDGDYFEAPEIVALAVVSQVGTTRTVDVAWDVHDLRALRDLFDLLSYALGQRSEAA